MTAIRTVVDAGDDTVVVTEPDNFISAMANGIGGIFSSDANKLYTASEVRWGSLGLSTAAAIGGGMIARNRANANKPAIAGFVF